MKKGGREGGLNWPFLLGHAQSAKCTEFLAESLDFTIVVLNRPLFEVLLERIWSLDH